MVRNGKKVWFPTSFRLDKKGKRQLDELVEWHGLRSMSATVARLIDEAHRVEREREHA